MGGGLSIEIPDKSWTVLYAINGFVTHDGVLLGGYFESMIAILCSYYSVLVLNICTFEGVHGTGSRILNKPLLRDNWKQATSFNNGNNGYDGSGVSDWVIVIPRNIDRGLEMGKYYLYWCWWRLD